MLEIELGGSFKPWISALKMMWVLLPGCHRRDRRLRRNPLHPIGTIYFEVTGTFTPYFSRPTQFFQKCRKRNASTTNL